MGRPDHEQRGKVPSAAMADDDATTQESAHDIVLRAVALFEASNWADARPLFEQVMTMPDCSQKGYDSCIANVAMCAHHLGDHQTALTNIAMFLESSATPTSTRRPSGDRRGVTYR